MNHTQGYHNRWLFVTWVATTPTFPVYADQWLTAYKAAQVMAYIDTITA